MSARNIDSQHPPSVDMVELGKDSHGTWSERCKLAPMSGSLDRDRRSAGLISATGRGSSAAGRAPHWLQRRPASSMTAGKSPAIGIVSDGRGRRAREPDRTAAAPGGAMPARRIDGHQRAGHRSRSRSTRYRAAPTSRRRAPATGGYWQEVRRHSRSYQSSGLAGSAPIAPQGAPARLYRPAALRRARRETPGATSTTSRRRWPATASKKAS